MYTIVVQGCAASRFAVAAVRTRTCIQTGLEVKIVCPRDSSVVACWTFIYCFYFYSFDNLKHVVYMSSIVPLQMRQEEVLEVPRKPL